MEQVLLESEKKFRILLENIKDWVWQVDTNGVYSYVSPQAERMMGYSVSEILGKTPFDFMTPDEAARVRKIFAKIAAKQEPIIDLEDRMVAKNGEEIIFKTNATPLFDQQGTFIGYMGTCQDITEQKKAIEELQKSRNQLKQTLDATTDGIWTWNFKTDQLYFSPKYYTMLGYEPNEFPADYEHWVNLIHPDDKEQALTVAEKYLKTKPDAYENEFRLKTKNGEYRWIHTRGRVTERDDTGNAVYMIGSHEDITEKKEAEEKINKQLLLFQSIVETTPSLLLITDKSGNISYISPNAQQYLGYTPNELTGTKKWWVHPDDTKRAQYLYKKTFNDYLSTKNFEYKAIKKNGEVWYASSSWEPVLDTNGKFNGIVMQTIDITERIKREQQLKKQLLTYTLQEGYTYLHLEKTPATTLNAFNELLAVGYQGTFISRTPQKHYKEKLKPTILTYWLSEKKTHHTIPPTIPTILKTLEKLPKKQVILIDRLDYLITKNGFNKTLTFIQQLTEIGYLNDHIIILTLDPDTIDPKQQALLQKETNPIIPKHDLIIDQDLKELIAYIYQQNINNHKPNYTEIGTHFHISKPTTRNKIQQLIQKGYLIEHTIGRKKILEVTEKSRQLFI